MARPARPRPAGSIHPSQVLVVLLVLGVFLAGVLIGGLVGAGIVAVLALAAGALLAARWSVTERRIRTLRLAAVLACLAVAVSVAVRS